MHFVLKRNCVSVNLIFLLLGFFLWLWFWCDHWRYIAVSKGYSSNLKASSSHRSWLFLACHTSTCTLATNKIAPASNFLAFVSIRQSCKSILNRMLTYFFFFSGAMKAIYLHSASSGWRNGKEDCRKVQMDHVGIKKRNEACHTAKFHKGHFHKGQTSPPSAQLWKNRHIFSAVTSCDFTGTCKLIADLRLNFNSHLL